MSFQLWDGPEYATGTALLHIMGGILEPGATIVRDVGGEDGVDLAAVLTEPWVEDAVPGTVVRYQHPTTGTVTEWWVADREDGFQDARGVDIVRFRLAALSTILASVGPIEGTVSPFIGWTNLGLKGSARNFLATFAIPWLTAKGIDYISIGTMDSNEVLDFRFDLWTPQQLVVELAKRTNQEWQLARNDVDEDYQIDIVAEIGSGGSTAWASEGLNLKSLRRRKERNGLWTVMRPTGILASGDERRADISQNSWRVASVATDNVVAEAHNGGDGPIGEDDQWIGNYLEAADGTLWEILDTTASSQTFAVAVGAGSNFTAGDDVSIVRNSSGDPLTELESPAAVALYGRLAGPLELPDRGERNWTRNPLFSDWPDNPLGYACRKDGAESGTSYDLKELPVGLVIAAGDVLIDHTSTTAIYARITTGDTVDGSGLATVVVAVTLGSLADNRALTLLVQDAEIDDWTRTASGTSGNVLLQTPRSGTTTVAAKVNGNQTFTSSTKLELPLKNLTASTTVIPPGALIVDDGTGGIRGWVIAGGTADGSGLLTVDFYFSGSWSPTDGDDLTLHLPDLSGYTGTDAPGGPATFGALNYLDQDISVRYRADRPTLYVNVYYRGLAAVASAGGGWQAAGTILPPKLELITTPSTVVDSDTGRDWTPAAIGENEVSFMRASATMTATDEFRIRIHWPAQTASTGISHQRPWFWIEAIEMHLGPQTTIPVIDGSHASVMIQKANLVRADVKDWTGSYEADLLELAEALDVSPAVVRAAEGALLRVRSDRLSIDEELRIVGSRGTTQRLDQMSMILAKRPHRFTREAIKGKRGTLYGRVDVEGVVTQTFIATEEPPKADGLPDASANDDELGSDEPLALAPFQAPSQ